MELNYYISLANIPDSLIYKKVLYGESFDFVANLFVDTYLDDSLDESFPDYTCFLTFEKRRHHSQVLLSNFDGNNGYTIGINATNELFIDYPKKGVSFTSSIRFGNKNCLAIKKSSNYFTIYKYDIISGVFSDYESFSIQENTLSNLDLSGLYIGGRLEYTTHPTAQSSVKYFSGNIDQFLFIAAVLDESIINIIFNGFKPLTFTPVISSNFTKSESFRAIDTSLAPYETYLLSGFRQIDQNLFTGFALTGLFGAEEQGRFGISNKYSITGLYYSAQDFCTNLGLSFSPTPDGLSEFYLANLPGSIPAYSYSGVTKINKFTDRIAISRRVTLTLSGTGYRLDYDSAYYSTATSTGYTTGTNESYYTQFKMNGVFSDDYSLEILYSGQLKAPTGYHIPGQYDFVQMSFYVPQSITTSSYYLNGQPEIYGVKTNSYIFITGSGPGDYLEYDNTNNYAALGGGPASYIVGDFYPKSSRVLESDTYNNLILNTDYIETSSGNLYHGATSQNTGQQFLFNL